MSTEAKDQLRAQLKTERAAEDAASRKAADELIRRNVLETQAFQQAHIVLPYLSFGSEIDTRLLIETAWDQGKRVALPRCLPGAQLAWHLVENLDGLALSSFGMEEPDPQRCALLDFGEATDAGDMLAIVPGLAFDKQGYRLGYGGGFYDRFLADFAGVSMGLCRDARHFDSLSEMGALGRFDLPVNIVVTESGAYVCTERHSRKRAYSSNPIAST